MKKLSDHEIFIAKIYIYVMFSNFTKILNHENLKLYRYLALPVSSMLSSCMHCASVPQKKVCIFKTGNLIVSQNKTWLYL